MIGLLICYFSYVSSVSLYLQGLMLLICVRSCMEYAKMNPVSHASRTSFSLIHELGIMIVLDEKVHCLREVHISAVQFKVRKN